ncbi:MAG TPA: hypothetical protein VJB90_02055 [Candidatus Nanoarchaeia archaeon]|nr:hypothetical protein [Candidatus Nanoarchaeia archaeon]
MTDKPSLEDLIAHRIAQMAQQSQSRALPPDPANSYLTLKETADRFDEFLNFYRVIALHGDRFPSNLSEEEQELLRTKFWLQAGEYSQAYMYIDSLRNSETQEIEHIRRRLEELKIGDSNSHIISIASHLVFDYITFHLKCQSLSGAKGCDWPVIGLETSNVPTNHMKYFPTINVIVPSYDAATVEVRGSCPEDHYFIGRFHVGKFWISSYTPISVPGERPQ